MKAQLPMLAAHGGGEEGELLPLCCVGALLKVVVLVGLDLVEDRSVPERGRAASQEVEGALLPSCR